MQKPQNLLTIKEVMKRLNISRTTLHALRTNGKLKPVLIIGSVRYSEKEIERFIKVSTEKA